jgi:hypothetical protein
VSKIKNIIQLENTFKQHPALHYISMANSNPLAPLSKIIQADEFMEIPR